MVSNKIILPLINQAGLLPVEQDSKSSDKPPSSANVGKPSGKDKDKFVSSSKGNTPVDNNFQENEKKINALLTKIVSGFSKSDSTRGDLIKELVALVNQQKKLKEGYKLNIPEDTLKDLKKLLISHTVAVPDNRLAGALPVLGLYSLGSIFLFKDFRSPKYEDKFEESVLKKIKELTKILDMADPAIVKELVPEMLAQRRIH